MRRIAAATVLALSFALPAQAHEAEPLPQVPSWTVAHWRQEWVIRAAPALTLELLGEWRWMQAHYFPGPERRSSLETQKATPRLSNPPSAISQAYGLGVEQWRNLVAVYFPADQVERTLRVMACESGGDPNAYNPSGASGLMQVLASWADNFGLVPSQLFDPATNLQVARWLWDDGESRVGNGWVHWVCKG